MSKTRTAYNQFEYDEGMSLIVKASITILLTFLIASYFYFTGKISASFI